MHPFFPQVSNQVTGNSNGFFPNGMQMQPQAGFMNPQMRVPFSGPNPHMGNAGMPNRPSGVMNVPNLQNGQMGNSILGWGPMHPAQSHVGFAPQNLPQNLPQNFSAVPGGFPMNGSFGNLGQTVNLNPAQVSGQLFGHNTLNVMNPNGGFQKGQFYWQNQLPNMAQVSSPYVNMGGFGNQIPQGMVPQSNAFVANPQFGLMQGNSTMQPSNLAQQNSAPFVTGTNAINPMPSSVQQMQGNAIIPSTPGLSQQQRNLAMGPSMPGNAIIPSTPGLSQQQRNLAMGPSGNTSRNDGMQTPASKNKHFNKFRREPDKFFSNGRFQKPQNPHFHDRKRNDNFSNKKGGNRKPEVRNPGLDNPPNQSSGGKKRSLAMYYTKEEVRQWRQERKKNYPTKINIEKKLARLSKSKVEDKDAEIWRQQLKDILAKQVELGYEVPEIPPHYLSGSGSQVHGREENKRQFDRNDRSQNRSSKRGRFGQNKHSADRTGSGKNRPFNKHDRFRKKSRVENDDSSNAPSTLRKPTLLEKLLSSDIKRDQSRLLQAFRFMVNNSFFKDWPEKPLKFPEVIVKGEYEVEVVEERPPSLEGALPEASNNLIIEELDDADGTSEENDDDASHCETIPNGFETSVMKGSGKYTEEEEEGEVTE